MLFKYVLVLTSVSACKREDCLPGNLIACISRNIHERKISQIHKNHDVPKYTAAGTYLPYTKKMEVVVNSCVHGYHVYQEICKQERDNTEDRHAVRVAVCKAEDITVSHVPRTISCLWSAFIRRGGVIDCIVEGTRCYSSNLLGGGMEIPCKLILIGTLKIHEVHDWFLKGHLKAGRLIK